jgi:hypothetical protein
MVKYAYEKYLKGYKIFTNFGLDFPEGKGEIEKLSLKFFENYNKSGMELLNAVILIDEAHVFFDSRNAMLKRNKIFSKFVTQSRKRSVDLLYTSQDKSPQLFFKSGQVELRLRKLTDYIIFCQCFTHNKEKFIINTVCDRYGIAIKKKIFKADDYYRLYDTNEIIDFDTVDMSID